MSDATTCPPKALFEAIGQFLNQGDLSSDPNVAFTKCSGGVNNRVYRVHTLKGETFVLRVYNNGGLQHRVRYEHMVLHRVGALKGLPFQVPQLLTAPGTGHTWVPVPSMEAGTEACLFHAIPGKIGDIASLTFARTAGAATASLVDAMGKETYEPMVCPNPRFRDVYSACPGTTVTPEQLRTAMAGPLFDAQHENVKYLLEQLDRVLTASKNAVLPEQQIHAGDNDLCVHLF
jgi:Ser/Thr protein kinase RdoA (MazF antagonist)